MRKRNIIGAAALSLCLTLGLATGVSADGRKVVTLGADLDDNQKQVIMNYFGVTADQVDILTITLQDEIDHLSSFVPREQIGRYTVSCAMVSPTTSGGIQVKTANLNWVTCNMIATTLSTSGVVNCDVIAACPFEVSGTGALTGIIMAYEEASGQELEPKKKELATQELVITGQLAENVGQKEATAIVNEAKTEVISQNVTDVTVIQNIVIEAAEENEATLTAEEVNKLTDLLDQISQEDYNYDDMKDTLERVEVNVSNNVNVDVIVGTPTDEEGDNSAEEAAAQNAASEAQSQEQNAETEPSILDNTNDDALGEGVISGSTLEPETDAPETEAPIEQIVEPETELWAENTETWSEQPIETEAPAEQPAESWVENTETWSEQPIETEAPAEQPAETELWAENTETWSEQPIETEAPAEQPAETEGWAENTESWVEQPGETEGIAEEPVEAAEVYTEADLDSEQLVLYKKANRYLKKVFGLYQEPSDDPDYTEIDAMTVTGLVLDENTANTLMDKFDTFLLKLLVKGTEDAEFTEEDFTEYGEPEVKALCEELTALLVDDEDQLLLNVMAEDREKVCEEAEDFFKKLYDVPVSEDETAPEEGGELEGGEEFPEESQDFIPEATDDGTMEG